MLIWPNQTFSLSPLNTQPKRIYYLEELDGYALKWCEAIEDVKRYYYSELERREASEEEEKPEAKKN